MSNAKRVGAVVILTVALVAGCAASPAGHPVEDNATASAGR